LKNNFSPEQVDFLLSPAAIRASAGRIFHYTQAGKGHFRYHPEKLSATVAYVIEVIRQNYPDLKIPFHSRWGHFRVGKIDRVRALDEQLAALDPKEKARTKLDLVITSVLLDAGAGADWKFREGEKFYQRSEGLGVASLHLFLSGAFSSKAGALRADAQGLAAFSATELEQGFQVTAANPLVGVEGRVALLRNLGSALGNRKIFRDGRPGNILDYLEEKFGREIPATGILRAVLDGLGPIWPGRLSAGGVNLGDIWPHSRLAPAGSLESLVVLHKLSQWMTYSLIEPILEAGFAVTGVEKLTGLAEYRNGGLLLDSGLLSLAVPANAEKAWEPSSDLILEWRGLTVYLLDEIGAQVQKTLGMSPAELPLAKVLEGGTWWAGRFLAKKLRQNGNPPLQIESDGTVF
jgi:hypothetical protein